MHILVTGAAGLTERLAAGPLDGQAIERLTLTDMFAPGKPAFSGAVEIITADLATPGVAEKLLAGRPDIIFHTAGIVSAEAELDFEKGYRSNLDGMLALLEAVRATGDGYRPKLIFTSSCAAYGAPFPDIIGDDFHLTPLTSYGTQKAMCELLLADYTRRGFVDGVGLRLPAICVVRASPTRRRLGSIRASSASRSRASKRSSRWTIATCTPTLRRGRRSASSFMRRASPANSSAPASNSPCPAYPAPSLSRSRRCAGSPEPRSPPVSAASPIRW
jgi:nucleoside-diphosphate-sugar epimerase